MRLAVKLIGFRGFAGPEQDAAGGGGGVDLVLPDDATPDDLLQSLAAKYGPIFRSDAPRGARGPIRIGVFLDDEMLDDSQAPLADLLRPHSELSVALLRPFQGG